ncbi:MAG: DUF3604 domain-containing protein, partial [Gemmatimonadota bacterium]|nr:DUF3604 domain-containing protein [Gemmatimonadota bacterium]
MLKEKIMKGIGQARIEPDKPVVAGSRQTWILKYYVGKKGMKKGGSLRVTIPHGFTSPQIDEFYKDGFVTVECPGKQVSLSLNLVSRIFCAYSPELGHSGAFGKSIFVILEDGQLAGGDCIELAYGNVAYYGDEPWGPSPPEAPILSGAHQFTVAVDYDGTRTAPLTGYFLLPEQPVVKVLPEKAERLITVAPSNVEPGKSVSLRIITVDKYLNPVKEQDTEYAVRAGGGEKIYTSRNGVIELPPLPDPGKKCEAYAVNLLHKKGISGLSNPVRSGKYMGSENLYWGDIHAHTACSDGLGTPVELLAFARDVAGLDFAAMTDHDDIGPFLSREQWEDIQQATASVNRPGEFVTFLGYEYRSGLADMNVYYPGDKGPMMCGKDEKWDNPLKLLPALKQHEAMIIPHQHFGADWRGVDPAVYRVMEVYSQHGSSEYLGCPRQIPYLNKQLQKSSSGNLNTTFQEILALGVKLGVTAGSDSHSGRPGLSNWTRVTRTYNGGLTAVFAGNKTREDIWKALYERHCYGTTGPRIYLDFSINGHP